MTIYWEWMDTWLWCLFFHQSVARHIQHCLGNGDRAGSNINEPAWPWWYLHPMRGRCTINKYIVNYIACWRYGEKWGRERGLRVLGGDMWSFQHDDQGRSNKRRHLNNVWGTWESECADVWGRSVPEGRKSRCKGKGIGWVCETVGRPERKRQGQVLGEEVRGPWRILLGFHSECDRSLMESLSWVVICSPLELQMSFWLLCRAQSWKGWGKKQGDHPRAYAAILRRDDGCAPRTAAVEVVRGGRILDVFWRHSQEDFLIVWTWIMGSGVTKDDSKISFRLCKDGDTIYL